MDSYLSTVIPAVLFIGGGAVLYSKCVKPSSANKKPSSNAKQSSSQTTSPPQGKSNTKKQSNDDDEEYTPDDFLTTKQKKELKEKEKRQAEQENQQALIKAKKAKEEQRRIAAAAKAAEAEKNQPPQPQQQQQQQGKNGKKGASSPQGNGAKLTPAQQQAAADKKKAEKEQRKKEQRAREQQVAAELEKKLALQQKNAPNGGKVLSAKQLEQKEKDKQLLEALQDVEWTPVMTKSQKQRKKELLYASSSSDDSDIEVISSSTRGKNSSNDDIEEVSAPVVEEKVRVMVPVPVDKRHVIIGAGGVTIEAIKTKTGCWISVPKDEDIKKDFARMYNQAPVYIAVEGPKDGAAKAKKIILQLIEKGFSTALTGNTSIESKFQVEPIKRAAIIGPKGSYMDKLQKELNVKIVMPDRLSRDTTVLLFGEREQVNICKRALQQLVEQGFSSVTHPTFIRETMEFPAASRHRLIGRAGQTIKQIQANTRCKLAFPASPTKDIVHIMGDKDNIPLAIKAINRVIEQMQYDEEAAAVAAMRGDEEELDEDLMQFMYIPDEEEEEEY